jgi:predicted HD superfamily hydrolase involved in NAD metabolism
MADIIAQVLPAKRYQHSLRVAETAVKLARCHQIDEEKAQIAGMFHDYCKSMPKEKQIEVVVSHHLLTSQEDLLMPQVLHGPAASVVLKEKHLVEDAGILEAVRFHTTGCANMSDLSKIIFIADYVEPGRETPNIGRFFELAEKDLNKAMIAIIDQTTAYLTNSGKMIHLDMVRCRNHLLVEREYNY